MEEASTPTPMFHAGETGAAFFNHAWVRIIWRDMTIDVEPTWYDNGTPLEWGAIEEIIPNKVNSYPSAYLNYSRLHDTRLILPITRTLKAGASQSFVIASKDYSAFSVIINDTWHNFIKNDETGNYELILTIPGNIGAIEIYGVTESSTQRKAIALIQYDVVQDR